MEKELTFEELIKCLENGFVDCNLISGTLVYDKNTDSFYTLEKPQKH